MIIDGYAKQAPATQFAGINVFPPEILATCSPSEYAIVFTAPERYWLPIVKHAQNFGPFPVTLPFLRGREEHAFSERWERAFAEFHSAARREAIRNVPIPKRIALWIHGLVPGGAERQIVLLSKGLVRCGHDVTLITGFPDHPRTASWSQLLADEGIERIILSEMTDAPIKAGSSPKFSPLCESILEVISDYCLPLSVPTIVNAHHALVRDRPDGLITYLDQGNTTAGLAGVMAGVPLIHMSGRNVSPLNFPEHTEFGVEKQRLHRMYRLLLGLPGITISNNSEAGAKSYADWIGIDRHRIPVISNAFAALTSTNPKRPRQKSGYCNDAPIIVGIMRLVEEKDPLGFVEVVAHCTKRIPTLRAVLIGDGYLRDQVYRHAEKLGIASNICLLGQLDKPFDHIEEASILLLTSRMEGTPNVILEAQSLGCPVISTSVGGVKDVLAPCLQQYSFAHGAWQEMAEACIALLQDPVNMTFLSLECRHFMASFPDEQSLADQTLHAMVSCINASTVP